MNGMRRMLEVSIGRSKFLEVGAGICRQVSTCRNLQDRSRGGNAVGDRQPFGIAPGDFPEFLRGAPKGAETFGAFAQVGLVEGDADGDDVVVAAPGTAFFRLPLGGVDDQFDRGNARLVRALTGQ